MARIAEEMEPDDDPVQGYANFLHYRYTLAASQGRDVPTEEAFELWLQSGQPGYPLEGDGAVV